jgi:uncharacterized protein (AIM24 family)
MDLIGCRWCHAQNPPGTESCDTCGAPLDAADVVSDSGWREAPRLRDMTGFSFGTSTAQVDGDLVPVIELALGGGDAAFFEHHTLLWKDEPTALSAMTIAGGLKRSLGGMPFVMSLATGPGRVAFSRDAPGELVVLPLQPGTELDVREHAFLVASNTITYSFVRLKGLANVLHGGNGMFLDRFVTESAPGLLVLHGNGNVFERVLAAGEKLLVEPGAFLYKDAAVTMNAAQQDVKTGFGRHGLYLAEMVGPGRVGIQSMYVHHNAE